MTDKEIRIFLASLVLILCLCVVSFAFAATPQVGTITPSSGANRPNQAVTFTTTYSDADGWSNIQYVQFLVNSALNGANSLFVYYDQNTNLLYLRNDASTGWLGGYAPGSAQIIQNYYSKLDCAKTTVSGSGTNLTVKWVVTFKPTFTGAKNTYLYVKDDTGLYNGWLKKGTWIIDAIAPTGSIKINNDSFYANSTFVSLNLSAQDNTGGSGLSQMQFSNNNVTWSSPEAYVTTKTYTLALGDATKTVYVKFKDKAGNWSNPVSDSIILDTQPPVIVITSPQNGAILQDPQITLQGTVDGVSFSESRTLVEGENLLTKTAADLAGNTGSASVTVYYYSGTLIGPGGGEVLSSDGKIKVVIPAGALTAPQNIKILRLNNQSIESALPGNTALLSVAEFKPYGLVFSKPVEITYILDSPEIPGTPVEIGLYDAIQNKIIPVGHTTIVPADGYTITCNIMHFSTYAVLKGLISQGAPIGGGVKIPLPDLLTGAFSHAIAISVPPGRKGLQPSLGLSYRSSNANSWVGLGFSLNPGFIVRSSRLGPPTYIDTQDTFYLITDSGTTELVNLIDNLYQAKIESSFTKFYKETDDSWKVVAKDGSILRFGQATDSKETSLSGTYSWYLTKAIDLNGNYIDFTYTKDQGKAYLSHIDYTGNEIGITPTNSVEFYLEPREDISSSYISTSKIAFAKRLKEIQVKVNSGLVWRYELEYGYSPDTNRSLLKSVTQFGADGKNLPKQSLEYQKAK